MVIVGLGANLSFQGQTPRQNMENAIGLLDAHEQVSIVARSRTYCSSPVGKIDQPDYFNAVVTLKTSLTPPDLMRLLLDVEKSFGRVRSERWGPRTLDLDLIDFDAQVLDLNGNDEAGGVTLHLPHPRLHLRAFVMVPMAELVPDWTHPVSGERLGVLLARVDESQKIRPVET